MERSNVYVTKMLPPSLGETRPLTHRNVWADIDRAHTLKALVQGGYSCVYQLMLLTLQTKYNRNIRVRQLKQFLFKSISMQDAVYHCNAKNWTHLSWACGLMFSVVICSREQSRRLKVILEFLFSSCFPLRSS